MYKRFKSIDTGECEHYTTVEMTLNCSSVTLNLIFKMIAIYDLWKHKQSARITFYEISINCMKQNTVIAH